MKTFVTAVIMLVIAVVVGVGAFFAGTNYGQAQAQNTRNEFFRNRQGGGPSGAAGQTGQTGQNNPGARPAAFGTIKNVSGNTLQLTQQDGTTVTVTVDNQTAIQKTVNGTVSDLQPGDRITVLGDQAGANITARSIQIRPAQNPSGQ